VQLNVKRKLAIGTTAIAAAAFAGGAYAATQESATNARQAFLNDVAKRLNVSPKQLSAALQGGYLDQLQAAVSAGRLTQAQANAIKQRLQKTGATPPLGGRWFGPLGGGHFFGPRRGGPGGPGPGFHGFRAGFGPAGVLPAAASYLGISDTQLLDQLRSGKSLAEIRAVQAHNGKTVAGLEAALTAAVRSRLDKLVSAKFITAAQEQRILSNLPARLDKVINATGFKAGSGRRPPGSGGPALLTPSQAPALLSAD
jgi:hypothetical protein